MSTSEVPFRGLVLSEPELTGTLCSGGCCILSRLDSPNFDIYCFFCLTAYFALKKREENLRVLPATSGYTVYSGALCILGLTSAIFFFLAIRAVLVKRDGCELEGHKSRIGAFRCHPTLCKLSNREAQARAQAQTRDSVDQKPKPVTGWSMIVGNDVYKKRFSIDSLPIRIIRGLLALLLFIVILWVGIYLIITQPLEQLGEVETRTFEGGIWTNRVAEPLFEQLYVVNPLNIPSMTPSIDIKLNKQMSQDSNQLDCTAETSSNFSITSCPFSWTYIRDKESLDISFNFSRSFPGGYSLDSPLDIYLGFTDSAQDIYRSTPPVYLLPGSRLYVFGELYLKEKLANHQLAALVDGLGRIERERNAHSVLDGFATLGGIWTFLDGAFAFIFGASLMLILFERKPLSAYGLIHILQGGELTRLHGDPTKEEEVAIVALLRDHLLDSGPVGKTIGPGRT
ncbi:hypothetical protein NP233_g12816 [Leucocoprinus birnbaumii]|uniref:Uncharacterized protein n=1 Tax=Leucocoprinus birnbaumii TaxID=56174 RepID=A0AAD5VHX4_9AGAR|nr:hypothetical protein NP233_g12816 [Leucocoprinus birnbaumii]